METVSEFRTHKLKCWPEFFDAIKSGDKTFEVRSNDRNFYVGDVLRLEAWDPTTALYVGASMDVLVTYMTSFGQKDGTVVMAIRPVKMFQVSCANCGDGFYTYDNKHTHCSGCL